MFPGLWQQDLEGGLAGLDVSGIKNCNLYREGMHGGGSEWERRRFAGSWAEIGNFFTERVFEHWKGLPREVFKEWLDVGNHCQERFEKKRKGKEGKE